MRSHKRELRHPPLRRRPRGGRRRGGGRLLAPSLLAILARCRAGIRVCDPQRHGTLVAHVSDPEGAFRRLYMVYRIRLPRKQHDRGHTDVSELDELVRVVCLPAPDAGECGCGPLQARPRSLLVPGLLEFGGGKVQCLLEGREVGVQQIAADEAVRQG